MVPSRKCRGLAEIQLRIAEFKNSGHSGLACLGGFSFEVAAAGLGDPAALRRWTFGARLC